MFQNVSQKSFHSVKIKNGGTVATTISGYNNVIKIERFLFVVSTKGTERFFALLIYCN